MQGTPEARHEPSERGLTPKLQVALRVNGVERRVLLRPWTTLLDALREYLHLTGTKKGCDHGQCGACTVLINGRRALSCPPGQICSAVGLIAEGHAKTIDEIRELMSGNICRCGCYPNIVAAIEEVMQEAPL
jgi:xanthine dehydrogenase YagT iron-sulfur-binding subunit